MSESEAVATAEALAGFAERCAALEARVAQLLPDTAALVQRMTVIAAERKYRAGIEARLDALNEALAKLTVRIGEDTPQSIPEYLPRGL